MNDFKSHEQRALEEFARRTGGEAEKALEKYGDVALAPEGHPDYDIFDYLINELVGMRRYGEMTIARAELMFKLGVLTKAERDNLNEIGTDCVGTSIDLGVRLIMAHHSMKDKGLMLGTPEKTYKKDVKSDAPRGMAKDYTSRNSIFHQ